MHDWTIIATHSDWNAVPGSEPFLRKGSDPMLRSGVRSLPQEGL